MSTLRRVTSTIAVLVLLLSLTAVPALAAAVASASLLTGDVLSGQTETVTFRVNNDGATGGLLNAGDTSIDAIQVEIPGQVFTDDITPVDVPGWFVEYDAEIGFLYGFAEDGAEIAPGASLDFGFSAVAERVNDDTDGSLNVFVSDDGGMTLAHADNLPLTSRILEVTSATLVKPAGALNGDLTQVTAGQDTASFEVSIANHAGVAKDVTVAIDKVGGSSSVSVSDVTPNVAGNSTAATVTMPATFGPEGNLQLEASATSGPSAALAVQLPQLAVQRAFAATYVPESITPATAVQGDDVAFTVNVNKVGAQPAAINAFFAFDSDLQGGGTGTYRAPEAGRTGFDFAAGSVNGFPLEFPQVTIPANFANGDVQPTITANGVDHNGATIVTTITPDLITLDRFVPVVDLVADVGDPEVGTDAAAGDGRPISFSGTAYLDGSRTTVCDDCTIEGTATLRTYRGLNGSGGESGDPQSFNVVINDGQISGSRSFTFPEGTLSARAEVTVAKTTGLLGTGVSNVFEVDILAPEILQALTQRDDDGDTILVTMTELVDGSNTTSADWSVDNNFVTAVTPIGDPNATTQFELELSQRLASRNATPVVSYDQFRLNGPVFDRVALDLLAQAIKATDGIVPEAPVLDAVQELPLQADEFWTNQVRPTISLSNLVPGDVLRLYFDADRDGQLENDELLTSPSGVTVTDAQQDVTPSRDLRAKNGDGEVVPLPNEYTGDLVAVLADETGNFSPRATEVLNYDVVVPELASFAVANGNEVTVTFTEAVPRGRDAAFDWTVFATQDGNGAYRTVESVTYVSDTERRLIVSAASYDPTAGDIQRARFKYRGAPADRYEDRATNAFANDETSNDVS